MSSHSSASSSPSPSSSPIVVPDKFGNHYLPSELKMLIIGLLISAALYGILLMLCLNCFFLLSSHSGTTFSRGKTPRRKRLFLCLFMFYMSLLGTIAFVFNIIVPINLWITPAENLLSLPFAVIDIIMAPVSSMDLALNVLATWGSHGFLLWRCLILYEDMPKIKAIIFRTILFLMAMTELAFGAMGLSVISFKVPWSPYTVFDTFEVISLSINTILSAFLVSRILYRQWRLREVFGQSHGSAYSRIVMICVESSLMTWILDVLLIISIAVPTSSDNALQTVDRTSSAKFMYYKLLVYFNAIAPVLIILRVARGKISAGDLTEESIGGNGSGTRSRGRISALRFDAHTSTIRTADLSDPVDDGVLSDLDDLYPHTKKSENSDEV